MNGKREDSALCAFDDARAGVVAACGGKAVGLHRLVRAGLPVPPGFCVTTAAFEQVVAGDRAFRAAVLSLDADADGPSLRDRARAVRVAVLACPLPQPFAREVVTRGRRSPGAPPSPCDRARPRRTSPTPRSRGSKTRSSRSRTRRRSSTRCAGAGLRCSRSAP